MIIISQFRHVKDVMCLSSLPNKAAHFAMKIVMTSRTYYIQRRQKDFAWNQCSNC